MPSPYLWNAKFIRSNLTSLPEKIEIAFTSIELMKHLETKGSVMYDSVEVVLNESMLPWRQ
jgi:hypothetical protein